jgi:hypothetical protein
LFRKNFGELISIPKLIHLDWLRVTACPLLLLPLLSSRLVIATAATTAAAHPAKKETKTDTQRVSAGFWQQ